MPVFSIVIPFYNTEPKYYRVTFGCVKAIPADIAEVIVVDDGSESSAGSELAIFLERELPASKLYRKENGGQNSARQFGIDRAEGKYVLFLDSDDYLERDVLLELAEYLNEHDPDVVAFNYDTVAPDGKLLGVRDFWEDGFHKVNLQRLSLASDSLWRQCYCLQRLRELPYGLVQGVKIAEDLSSSLSFNLALNDCVSFGGVLYHYVKRPTSMVHNTPRDAAFDVLEAFDEVVKRCGPDYSDCRAEVEWMAIQHCVGWNSLRLLRAGVDCRAGKSRTFGWMQENFPDWRRNPYIKDCGVAKKPWFRLGISGRWHALGFLLSVWDIVKPIARRGER